ncbi:MAG: hypothetical protein P8X48_04065 [Acidiferrobacteraceae bacterium]|jgi:hypothetical protein
MSKRHARILTVLTLVLTASLAVASYYGVFVPGIYARDSASLGTQGIGQDALDLFFTAPLLLISLFFVLRGSRLAWFVYGGTVLYLLYSYVLYALGVHFNRLFLVYCLVLGSSFYAFALAVYELGRMPVSEWFSDRAPLRVTAVYFLVIAVLFYGLWLKDVLPAVLSDSVPASVRDNDLLVNPVHVLDLSIVLPGLAATAILLLRRHALGYVLAPVFLVFLILLTLAIAAMVLALKIKGVSEDVSLTGFFVVLTLVSSGFLFLFLRAMRTD